MAIFEVIVALLIGVSCGVFTGLTPGLHINLIATITLSFLASSTLLQSIQPISLAVFITSMSITHTFLDFIPSIFLGAPEEDSFLSTLPGHELLKQGKGYEAIILTLKGSLIALPIIILFIPIFIIFLPKIYSLTIPIIAFILIFSSLYLILREEFIINSLIVFILAGFLGLFAFNLPIKEPLLPLLTGLFGTSSLLLSIKSKTKIPKQTITPIKQITIPKSVKFKSTVSAALSAPLCSFLPGIGAGHAAVIASDLSNQQESSPKPFLFMLGIINTIVMALSFITIYSINKTRTGSASAVSQILETITLQFLLIIIITIIISGIFSFFLGIKLSKFFSKNISKINYQIISIIIILFLITLTLISSNLLGLLILLTGTSLGIFCISSKVKRINLMGSLLLPTIIFFLAN